MRILKSKFSNVKIQRKGVLWPYLNHLTTEGLDYVCKNKKSNQFNFQRKIILFTRDVVKQQKF